MKVHELLTEAKKKEKKIPKPKPRPKKTLWFNDPNFWHADLQFAHGGKYQYHSSQEEEESARSFYATDPTGNHCFGVWQGPQKRGVTFHKPRLMSSVKHPRLLVKRMENDPTEVKTNIK
jgi:hypothetical protein